MRTVYLSRKEAIEKNVIIDDIKEYFEKYSIDKRNNAYSMLSGSPIIINVDGTYVLLNKVLTMDVTNKADIEQLIAEIKAPKNLEDPFIRFKWKA